MPDKSKSIWHKPVSVRPLLFYKFGPICILLPELLHFRTATERMETFDDVKSEHRIHSWLKLGGVALMLVLIPAMRCLPRQTLLATAPWLPTLAVVLVFSIFALFYIDDLLHILLYRGHLDRALRERRIRAGENLCASCGYDLTGLKGRRCPECGHHSTIRAGHSAQKSAVT